MTPDQALKLLDDATATVQSDRKGHLAIVEALQVLREYLAAQKKPE
jgi:hypothetical protein